MKRVRDKLFSLFDVYMKVHSTSMNSASTSSRNQDTSAPLAANAMISEECIDIMKVNKICFSLYIMVSVFTNLFKIVNNLLKF